MNKSKHLPKNGNNLLDKIREANKEIAALKHEVSRYKTQVEKLNNRNGADQTILDDIPDFICRFSPDGTITYANPAYCTYVNKPYDAIITSSIYSYVPKADRSLFKQYLDSLSKDCPVRMIDYRAVLPGEELRWQQWSLRALFDDSGCITEYLSTGRDITNLKHVETGLIDALEKYSTIFESSNDAILLQDGKNIVDCNTAALRFFRCREKKLLLNKHYTDFSPQKQPDGEDSRLKAQKHINRAVKRGMDRFQWVCKRFDGSTFPSDVILSPFNLEGRLIVAAVIRDISEQKTIEDALKKSEEKYRDLVENINDAIFSLEDDGTVTYVSPAIRKILGYTPDEITGALFYDFIHPDDLELIVKRYEELISGKIYPLEYRLVKRNGNPCWVRTYSRSVLEGDRQRIFGIITDISKRKKAEEDLKKAYDKLEDMVKDRTAELRSANRHLRKEIKERERVESRLRKSEEEQKLIAQELRIVLNGITDNITLQDRNLNIVWANEAAAGSLNMSPGDLIGKTCYQLWHGRHEPCKACPVKKALETGSTHEGIQVTPDTSIWEVHGYPLKDEQGRVSGAIEITRNVTERKMLEDELIKRQRIESLGTLAGGIAHDFNNILTVILGNTSFSKMLLNTEEKAYERLCDVENAALKAKELAGRLLTFSKGGSPLKNIVSMDRFLRDTIILTLQRSDITPRFTFNSNLWPVEIDESQIAQVIHNIITNAQDAMPEGGTLSISCENITTDESDRLPVPSGNYVKVSIADTGIGIEKEHIHNIFDPFFTTKKQGYGLGLATSYSIIKKHGGYITAASQEEKGTSIIIYLPASPEPKPHGMKKDGEMFMGGGNILFMDDEEFIRDLAKSILSHLGYRVTFAKNGEEAIKEYSTALQQGTSFDAVILDLIIPEGMGGRECIKKLREIDPEVKAIVSSGYSNDPVMSDPHKYGFNAFITKPYKIQTLSKILRNIITEH
ncbi:MAG: PAS domain S-box protein [Deltaproteobacteria bacterium]|nr:PAS domain S-box protein [Deltaproteobacteria bacterium]